MKRILIPVDFSPASMRAIQYTSEIFGGKPLQIFLLHAKKDGVLLDDEIETKYNELAQKILLESGFESRFLVRAGNLEEEVEAAIIKHNINLVISGTSGRFENGTLSHSASLMSTLNIPLIIVPENIKQNQIKKIAYANDFQNISDPTVFKALWDIARTFEAEVHVLHVNRNNETVDKEEDIIEYYLDHIDHEYVLLSNPDIEQALDNYILEKGIDLLVILPRKRALKDNLDEKSLTKNLAQHAIIPILTLA